ncbi:hypothetical protein DFR70_103661 [Nocardia tenerifensis]|uniref:Uncharacterized protein n=1 Tax=Nocardia tenerifensis TaxID=228006 RepID=A0A318KA88_9NOCA|nr:hypothetical protein [Nocardia tenerifensis]PXX66906.1 hypothetical protein DFR70_103661 [Nocardia tenerifensis]
MRPTSAGTILDASALTALRRSIFAQTVVQFSVREQRPLVIPATSLYVAVLAGANAADFDASGYTVIPFSQAIVPGVAAVALTAGAPIAPDVAHVVWEAQVTGYPVLTDDPAVYGSINVPIDLEVL